MTKKLAKGEEHDDVGKHKRLLHHMQAVASSEEAQLVHGYGACHLHPKATWWQCEKIHESGNAANVHVESSMCNDESQCCCERFLVACSTTVTSSPMNNENYQQVDGPHEGLELGSILRNEGRIHHEWNRNGQWERGDMKTSERVQGSWSGEKDLKQACKKLCEQIQWKSEKHYQEVSKSSFREILQDQDTLHALHEQSVESSKEQSFIGTEQNVGQNGYQVPRTNCNRNMLILSQSYSPFSDATFPRPFQECSKERPMSAPINHGPMQRSLASPQLVPDDLLYRYSMGNRVWTPHVKKEICVGCKGVKPREDVVPLRSSPKGANPSLRPIYFRSKSAELRKKTRFCTGLNQGKGETMLEDAAKKMLRVLPVIELYRDKTKGVWNRKANQKEWDYRHKGCCSEHWVSVLDKNNKVYDGEGCAADLKQSEQKYSTRANVSPMPTAMSSQKFQVQGARCRPHIANSLNPSSSPLSSLKSIVDDMSRLQSASLSKQSDVGFSTPKFASKCKSREKPSIAVTPTLKLKNPGLNSTTWLLAKVEALKNESFTKPKALQIAKEHGIVLDKEDEAALKKFLESEHKFDPRLDLARPVRSKSCEKYFNLSDINTPTSSILFAAT